MSQSTTTASPADGTQQPVSVLSPLDNEDTDVLTSSGVETVGDFLDAGDEVKSFLRAEEYEAAIVEAENLIGDTSLYEQALQEHASWHDEMVRGGHDPVTEIDSITDITQPAGRPREDLPVDEFAPSVAEGLEDAGYESGSDLNEVSPEGLADDIGVSIEKAQEVIDDGRTQYHGLPVLEDNDHPLVPDKDTYRAIWTRRTLSGAKDVIDVSQGLAQNQYPICLVGYPGVGKSYLIAHICAITNRPMVSIDMDSSLMAEDVLGFHVPEDGQKVKFKRGLFPKAMRYGFLLNINELPAADAGVWLAMHQMTERNPQLTLKSSGERLKPHPAFRVTGTRNPNTEAFSGHGASNEASDSRWEEIWIDYLSQRAERELLDHMVNGDREIVSKNQLEALVGLAEDFRPGVEQPGIEADDAQFKAHVFNPQTRSNIPRLSTRELAQMCFKAERDGATLERAVQSVVRMACYPSHSIEAAIENARDVNL